MLNPRIKLRHLQAFLEVAKRRSFARAAESLAISQPGISKAIKELEEILGAALLERSPQGVSLTQAGLTLLRHAGPAMRTLEEGATAVGDIHRGSSWIRVGVLSTAESVLLPRAIQRWHAAHDNQGDIGVRVVSGTSAFLLSRLRHGELDLVVGRMTEAREIRDLTFEHLYYEPLVLAVRSDHPLAAVNDLQASSLEGFPWVIPPPQTTLRQRVDSFCIRHGLAMPTRLLETLSLPVGRGYVLSSEAIWFAAPREAIIDDVRERRLAELSLPLEVEGSSVGMCSNASMQPSLALESFCETLRKLSSERMATRT